MSVDEVVEYAKNAFSLLADLLDYPDEDIFGYFKRLVDLSSCFFGCDKYRLLDDLELSRLEEEYIRLFVTSIDGAKAPPYGSFYFEKRLMGRTTVDFISFLETAGYTMNDNVVTGPPDHVSLQVGFLSRLMEDGSFALACIMIKKYLSWFGEFAERVKKHSSIEFYSIVTSIALDFINIAKEAVCQKG